MEMTTKRLVLNEFEESDADTVTKLAGDKRVVKWTISIPYPYPIDMASKWIKSHQKQRLENNKYTFAIRLKAVKKLIGCVILDCIKEHDKASVEYWIGYSFWGKGFCTEAVQEVIKFGFEKKNLSRIWAECFTENIASKKVMEKLGMKHEGIMRNYFKRERTYLDLSVSSILHSEYEKL